MSKLYQFSKTRDPHSKGRELQTNFSSIECWQNSYWVMLKQEKEQTFSVTLVRFIFTLNIVLKIFIKRKKTKKKNVFWEKTIYTLSWYFLYFTIVHDKNCTFSESLLVVLYFLAYLNYLSFVVFKIFDFEVKIQLYFFLFFFVFKASLLILSKLKCLYLYKKIPYLISFSKMCSLLYLF